MKLKLSFNIAISQMRYCNTSFLIFFSVNGVTGVHKYVFIYISPVKYYKVQLPNKLFYFYNFQVFFVFQIKSLL